MKTRFIAAAVIAAFVSVSASAQSTTPAEKPHHLTKEERAARRDEIKAKLAAMTPEERKAFRDAQKEKMKEKWASLTPEQREKMKERMQARRERHGK